MKNLVVISLSVYLLEGCATAPESHTDEGTLDENNKSQPIDNTVINKEKSAIKTVHKQAMDEDDLLFYLLRREFSYWQGTPYRLGGDSKKGVDCSAFVKHIYRDSFNIHLPRTTEAQVQKGFFVYRDQLQIGDLIFFKTSNSTRHVGIYIGNNEFIHASTSKGVITSSLDNSYWKPRYWQAKRILN